LLAFYRIDKHADGVSSYTIGVDQTACRMDVFGRFPIMDSLLRIYPTTRSETVDGRVR